MSDMMREDRENVKAEHGFIVRARAHVEIRGMTEVLSFDENTVTLATTSGRMTVEGRDLRVNILDVREGNVTVDGHIDSIYYPDDEPNDQPHSLFGRIFH